MQHKAISPKPQPSLWKSWDQLANHPEARSFKAELFLFRMQLVFHPRSLCQHHDSIFVKHLHLILHVQSSHRVWNEPRRIKAARVTWQLWFQWAKQRKARHHAGYSFVGSKEKQQEQKKSPTKTIKFSLRGEREEKRSLDDLSTIIYGSIHSDDVGIWAVIMIVIIIVSEKNLYLGFM